MEALQRLHNRGSISTGYEIDNSCKFEDDNDEYLYRTNASGTNRKTWTVSWWFKQTEVPSTRSSYVEHWQGGVYGEAARAGIDNNDRLWIDVGGGAGNTGTLFRSLSSARLRDTAAWYHVVIACDSTQSTEADRLKVWLNGVEVTVWDQHQIPTLNFGSAIAGFAGIQMKWGSYDSTYNGYSGYLAECNYLDGVTATQNDFGEFDSDSGIWKPKEYTGSYGTNGSYLDFEIASDLGANAKGNDVNFTLNNITAADQATDTPTNNFATLNPLHHYYNEVSRIVITEGGTKVTGAQAGTLWRGVPSTFAVSKGKWYFEMETTNQYILIGTGSADTGQTEWAELTSIANPSTKAKMMYGYNGGIYGYNSSTDAWQYGFYFGFGNTDIVSVAVDLDNGHMYFRKDGAAWTDSGDPTSGSTGTGAIDLPWYDTESTVFIVTVANSGNTSLLNFGGYTAGTISSAASDANGYGTFEYAPPSGYYALCTKNLAEYG